MYVTEQYLRFEIKEIHSMIKELSSDLGGDIRYLHQEIQELNDRLLLLQGQIVELNEKIKNES